MSNVSRDTLIVVYYVNADAFDNWEQKTAFIKQVRDNVNVEGIFSIIVPIYNENSRIECLNPKYLSEEEYKQIEYKISELQDNFDLLLDKIKQESKK